MADDVKLTFTGNAADAEKAIAQLERKFDGLENRIKRAGRVSKDVAKQAVEDVKNWQGAFQEGAGGMLARMAPRAIAGGALAAAGAVAIGAGQQNVEASNRLDNFRDRWLENFAKFQVQGGLNEAQAREQADIVAKALRQTPVTDLPTALDMNRQVASSGVAPQDIQSGAALQSLLRIQAATALVGKSINPNDAGELMKSVGQFIKSGGDAELNADDLTRVGAKLTALFATSDIQAKDLGFLAGKGATLTQFGLNESQQMGAFAATVDVFGADKGATGLAAFVNRTSTAANTQERVQALEKIGLTPEEVSMSKGGLGFFDVAEKIRDALKPLTQEQQNAFTAKMYGEEGQAAAAYILSDAGLETIRKRVSEAENPQVFANSVKAFEESRMAENARARVREDDALRKRLESTETTWGEARQAGRTAMEERRAQLQKEPATWGRFFKGAGLSAAEFVGERWFDTQEMIGRTPEQAGIKPKTKPPELPQRLANRPGEGGDDDGPVMQNLPDRPGENANDRGAIQNLPGRPRQDGDQTGKDMVNLLGRAVTQLEQINRENKGRISRNAQIEGA